jgi:hypothetical protein
MSGSLLRNASLCALLLTAVPTAALSWDGPIQWAAIQAECDARFAGQNPAKVAAAREACVRRKWLVSQRADRAYYADRAWAARKAWYASQWAARKAWYDSHWRHRYIYR